MAYPCISQRMEHQFSILKNRNRRALATTETDDRAIAVPAIIGESMGPPKTCNSPAATGSPNTL